MSPRGSSACCVTESPVRETRPITSTYSLVGLSSWSARVATHHLQLDLDGAIVRGLEEQNIARNLVSLLHAYLLDLPNDTHFVACAVGELGR